MTPLIKIISTIFVTALGVVGITHLLTVVAEYWKGIKQIPINAVLFIIMILCIMVAAYYSIWILT